MNQSQSAQKPSIVNGVGRRRIDKDGFSRTGYFDRRGAFRTFFNSSSQVGSSGGIKEIHDRLLYMHTCLIGQHVEVQKIDGHVYSGIFHAAVMDKEFGVMLKMARLIRESAEGIQSDSVREAARKPPIRTYVIQGNDFVQIIARDVSLNAISNTRSQEKRSDILTDTVLSQGWHRESERELMPWKSDDDFAEDLSFNLINTWSRNWDQFEANKALFGVESTFDEELYTTKLIRGPLMREREREAHRIAREIVGQQTRNTHVAEERGLCVTPELEGMDEESKYSAVGRAYEDVGDIDEDQHIDDETFGGSEVLVCDSVSQDSCLSIPIAGQSDGQESSILFSDAQDSGSSFNSPIGRPSPVISPLVCDPAGFKALNLDPSCPQVPDDVYREFKEFKQQKQLEALKALSESFKKELEPRSPRTAVSLAGSSASKKSPLNLYAKEFKLNPNAKAFTPSSCLARPTTVAQHPVVGPSPMFMQSAGTAVSSSHVNLQTGAQQSQFSQYNNTGPSAVIGANPTPYMQSSGVAVPGFPVAGVGGIIPGQPSVRISAHLQQQAISSFGHPHKPGFLQPNGQLYSQHMMYGQPANPVLFMPYSQGHPVTALAQGHLCLQPQQSHPRNRRQGDMSA